MWTRLATAVVSCALLTAACGEADPGAGPRADAGAAGKATVTVALGGDTMLARGVSETIERVGARYVWGDVLPLLRDADVAFVNLECVIAEGGIRFEPGRRFYFRAVPGAIDALTLAGIDGVSLANNHAMDYGGDALAECLRRLDEEGIAHVGAGGTLSRAQQPAIIDAGGLRVGFVGFADHYRLYAATPTGVGTNVVQVTTQGTGFKRVRHAIEQARGDGADLVVFSIHWGPNWRTFPAEHFREYARAVLDAGADVVHGHSAHVFQGIEIHDGKPILYDTGDLLDDYALDEVFHNDQQLLFLLRADRSGVRSIELVPLHIGRRRVTLARDAEFDVIAERIAAFSRELGTEVEVRGDRVVVTTPLR